MTIAAPLGVDPNRVYRLAGSLQRLRRSLASLLSTDSAQNTQFTSFRIRWATDAAEHL